MNKNMTIDLYEDFHETTKTHKKIISIHDYTHGEILSFINPYLKKNNSVLDIGCGTGSVSFYISQKVNFVTGIDISKKAIASCIENAKKFKITNADFKVSTLDDFNTKKKFDLIVLLEVIEHLEKDDISLVKIKNLLKKNGTLILSTPSVNAPLHKIGFLRGFDKRVGHLRRYSLESITNLVKKNGFRVMKTKKTEGVIRNLVFTSTFGGVFLKFINRSSVLAKLMIIFDRLSIPLLGESDLIVVSKKL